MDAQRREDAHILLDLLLDTVAKVEEKRAAFDKITPGNRSEAEKEERILQVYEQRREVFEEELEACIVGDEYDLSGYYQRKEKAKSSEAAEQEELQLELEEPALPQDFASYWRTRHAF